MMSRLNTSRRICSWLLVSALVGCSSDPSTDGDSTSGDTNAGGYTGLGPFTGISGHYGNGEPSTGGTTTNGSTTPGATGGSVTTVAGTTTPDPATGGTGNTGGTTGSTASTPTTGGAGGSLTTSPTGGTTSAATGGNPGFTWPGAYDPNGNPPVPSGQHSAGANCMSSACHAASQTSRAFAFGGTIYAKGTTTALAHAQIAIVAGGKTYTTYSGTNGNFWLPLASASSLDWTTAKVYVRNATGEVAKPTGTTVNASCNSCHGSSLRIVGP